MILRTKIPLELYECKVSVIVTSKFTEEFNKSAKICGYTAEEDPKCSGVTMGSDNLEQYHIVLKIDKLTHNLISHEVFHCANMICGDREIAEEESRAWLDGFVTEKIYRFLSRKKQKIKHG